MPIELDLSDLATQRILRRRDIHEDDIKEAIETALDRGKMPGNEEVMFAQAFLRRDCAMRVEYAIVDGKYRIFHAETA